MILRRYGRTVQSVEPNFDARAMTEIGFRRTDSLALSAEEFLAQYEPVTEHALTANVEGDVKDEAERALLDDLLEQIRAILAGLEEGHVLLVESQPGVDYPKTRDKTTTVVVGYENRLHFAWRVEPPLRVGVYRRKGQG